jgi:hypothetical protein
MLDEARRHDTKDVRVSAALDAEAATITDPDGGAQTVMIHPSFRRPDDPPGRVPPAIVRHRIQVSLLQEMANAAARDQHEEIERRTEEGELDAEVPQMVLGQGENRLLAQGNSLVAVLYAREIERVEFACSQRAATAACELLDAGVFEHENAEVQALLSFAELTFPEAFDRMVNHGHTQKYLEQFEQYVDADGLRTPTEEDLRAPTS